MVPCKPRGCLESSGLKEKKKNAVNIRYTDSGNPLEQPEGESGTLSIATNPLDPPLSSHPPPTLEILDIYEPKKSYLARPRLASNNVMQWPLEANSKNQKNLQCTTYIPWRKLQIKPYNIPCTRTLAIIGREVTLHWSRTNTRKCWRDSSAVGETTYCSWNYLRWKNIVGGSTNSR